MSKARRMLDALKAAVERAGDTVTVTTSYQGKSDWLVFHGAGLLENHKARLDQLKRGHTLHTDMGYTDRDRTMRIAIDDDHPQKLFWRTREGEYTGEYRNAFNPRGPVILVGLGRKSKRYLNLSNWEREKFKQLTKEFPGHQIIFRPKGNDPTRLPCAIDRFTPFNELVNGASLVVARHSNCCIDAILANVPFRAEDGAAMAYDGDRQTFMNKLMRWQYRTDQADEAWAFAKEMVC